MAIRHVNTVRLSEIDGVMRSRPVVLVGSGISDFAPTNLPSGYRFSTDLVDLLASGSVVRWPSWLRQDAKYLPFEALMEGYPEQEQLPSTIAALYGRNDICPNALHSELARALTQNIFSAIITTNYDLALESCFVEHDKNVTTVVRERDYLAWCAGDPRLPVYWKIHGTAAPGFEDTLVFNLAAEHRMEDWKRRFLSGLIDGRALIVIGYSGRDFDICPEISLLDKVESVVWLKHKWSEGNVSGLSPNQKRVYRSHGGLVVLGDIADWLEVLCSCPISRLTRTETPIELTKHFAPKNYGEWRLRVVDRLACPSFGLPLLASFDTPDREKKMVLTCHMLGHAGKYRQAAVLWESLSNGACSPQHRLEFLIEAANSFYIYGSPEKSRKLLTDAKRLAASIPITPLHSARLARVEIMYMMRRARLCKNARLRPLLKRIRREALPLYQLAKQTFESSSLDDLYIVQNDAERIGIAEQTGFAAAANFGFLSLGLRGMQCLNDRDAILSTKRRLSWKQLYRSSKWLRTATRYGWNPEQWKWAWIMLWHGRCVLKGKLWAIWAKAFFATEYPIRYRLQILGHYAYEAMVSFLNFEA